MMRTFVPKNQGPAVIRSMSSNTISDAYRDTITIAYQFIGSTVADTSWSFCGRTLNAPVMAGPIGLHGDKMPADADVLYARAAAEAGSVYWAHYHSPENWAKTLAEGIPAIRVIKPLRDIDAFIDEVKFDTDHGAIGYAMDIDHGITVYGEMDAQQKPFGPKTVDDLRRISEASPLPFFIKGVMTAHDALLAREAGAAGVVISGHNNRFPCAVPPLKALPGIRAAVGEDFVLVKSESLHYWHSMIVSGLDRIAEGTRVRMEKTAE